MVHVSPWFNFELDTPPVTVSWSNCRRFGKSFDMLFFSATKPKILLVFWEVSKAAAATASQCGPLGSSPRLNGTAADPERQPLSSRA